MSVLHLTFYLIFLVVILEVIKMYKRKLKKSVILYITQIVVLISSFLIIAIFAINKIFAIVPVLIAITITIDWIKSEKDIRITTLELIIFFYFIILSIGLILIFYGMVRA